MLVQNQYLTDGTSILKDNKKMRLEEIVESLQQLNAIRTHRYVEMEIKDPNPKLKDCPFCGNNLELQDPLDTFYPTNYDRTVYQVVCLNCEAIILGESLYDAVSRWNTRVGNKKLITRTNPCIITES